VKSSRDEVPFSLGNVAEVDHQRGRERVPGEDVVGRGHHDGGRVDVVEDALQVGLDLLRCAPPRLRGRAGKLVHVGALVVVEAQDTTERGEHGRGRLDPALLEAGVVVDRDRGELCDLLAAKLRDASLCPTFGKVDDCREPRLPGGDHYGASDGPPGCPGGP
jgi:hypothetical protein